MLDRSLPAGSGVPHPARGEGWLMKVLDGTIDRRARQARNTRDEGDPSSPQLFGIQGDDEVSLPLIEMGEQRGVFLFQFFFSAHTGSISGGSSIVTIIVLQALTAHWFIIPMSTTAMVVAYRHQALVFLLIISWPIRLAQRADCFIDVTPSNNPPVLLNNTAYHCGRNGFNFTASLFTRPIILNNIAASNGAWGLTIGSAAAADQLADGNAYYNNASGTRQNFDAPVFAANPQYTNTRDVVLSVNPFNNSAAGDFGLNNTAGGGAALRNAGIPVTWAGS